MLTYWFLGTESGTDNWKVVAPAPKVVQAIGWPEDKVILWNL